MLWIWIFFNSSQYARNCYQVINEPYYEYTWNYMPDRLTGLIVWNVKILLPQVPHVQGYALRVSMSVNERTGFL